VPKGLNPIPFRYPESKKGSAFETSFWSHPEVTLGDFSKQAASYRHSRPTYPEAMIDLLIEDAGVVMGDAVVEFGAGTGIFTRLLVERGFRVTAIEPNQEMRIHSDVPGARWIDATFEVSGLDDVSQRWAVAA
jgi:hypothetical protein